MYAKKTKNLFYFVNSNNFDTLIARIRGHINIYKLNKNIDTY